MHIKPLLWGAVLLAGTSQAACPFADPSYLAKRDGDAPNQQGDDPVERAKLDDSQGYMSTDVGGPMGEQFSLRAGSRGPTLLEDFIFRQKLQHFDHERVCLSSCFYQKDINANIHG